MPHPLDDTRLKLIRAQAHFQEFERRIDAYAAREPHAVIAEYDASSSDGPRYIFRLRVFESPDPHWGLIAGDFIHNIRSALDYLAWQLVLLNGQTPDRSVQFPIFTKRDDFLGPNGQRMYSKMSRAHIDRLDELQPYQAQRPEEEPLAVLNRLSNSDKHRVLGVPVSSIRAMGYDVVPLAGITAVHMQRSRHDVFQPVEDNAVLAEVPVEVAEGAEPHAYLDRVIRVEVSLGEDETAVETLRRIYEAAKRIAFDVFADSFGAKERLP